MLRSAKPVPFRPSPIRVAAQVAALALAWPSTAAAAGKNETFSGEYVVSFMGFTVARSTVKSTFQDGRFMLESQVSSAGLAQIFDSTKGAGTSTGSFVGKRTQPATFRADYVEGRKKKMTALGFRGGTVANIQNDPPLKKRGNDWVPVSASHLVAVVDPLSAGVIKASSAGEVCGRTIKIFDGEFRLDAILRPVARTANISGYGDQAVTCSVKVKPVAGYRKGRKALDYLEKQSRIIMAFAPLGSTGVYAPVYARIGTQLGTVTIKARAFKAAE